MAVADRIAVVDNGRLRQIASPEDLYRQPKDAFVAGFIGKANFFEPISVERGDLLKVTTSELGELSFSLDAAGGDNLTLAIRPEKLRLDEEIGDVRLTARLGDVAFQGERSNVELISLPWSNIAGCRSWRCSQTGRGDGRGCRDQCVVDA